jgi:hypothetical protein
MDEFLIEEVYDSAMRIGSAMRRRGVNPASPKFDYLPYNLVIATVLFFCFLSNESHSND